MSSSNWLKNFRYYENEMHSECKICHIKFSGYHKFNLKRHLLKQHSDIAKIYNLSWNHTIPQAKSKVIISESKIILGSDSTNMSHAILNGARLAMKYTTTKHYEPLDEPIYEFQCLICDKWIASGTTDVFNISLREDNVSRPFSEIIAFTLGINIEKKTSQNSAICNTCKQKVIEFYHLKRRSQVNNVKTESKCETSFESSSIVQEAAKILDHYIKKFDIKTLRIEESEEKLTFMKKPPDIEVSALQQEIIPTENFSIQIKQEVDEEDLSCVHIKEPECNDHEENVRETDDDGSNQFNDRFESSNDNQYESLWNLNQQILSIVESIHSKIYEPETKQLQMDMISPENCVGNAISVETENNYYDQENEGDYEICTKSKGSSEDKITLEENPKNQEVPLSEKMRKRTFYFNVGSSAKKHSSTKNILKEK